MFTIATAVFVVNRLTPAGVDGRCGGQQVDTTPQTAAGRVGGRWYQPVMCDDDFFASGWDVMVEARRTQHRFEVAMDQALEAYGMSYAQYRALEEVLASPGLHISELARRIRISRQAVTRLVDKLEAGGYLNSEREAHARYLTAGRHAHPYIDGIRKMADMPEDLDREMTGQERGQLVLLLRKADRATRPPRRPTWWLDP